MLIIHRTQNKKFVSTQIESIHKLSSNIGADITMKGNKTEMDSR